MNEQNSCFTQSHLKRRKNNCYHLLKCWVLLTFFWIWCSQFFDRCANQMPCHLWTLFHICHTWEPKSFHELSLDGSSVSRSFCSFCGRSHRRGRSQAKSGSRAWYHQHLQMMEGLQPSDLWHSRLEGTQVSPLSPPLSGEKKISCQEINSNQPQHQPRLPASQGWLSQNQGL